MTIPFAVYNLQYNCITDLKRMNENHFGTTYLNNT